jgi:hypothetical protein
MPEKIANSPIEPQKSKLSIPSEELDVPMVHVMERDWMRLRRGVVTLSNPLHWARELGWCAVTLAAACALGFIGWLPPFQQLPQAGQLKYSAVAPALGVSTIACVVIAILAFGMHASVEGRLRGDVDDVVEEMDEIHAAPAGTHTRRAGWLRRLLGWLSGLFSRRANA